MSGPAEGVSRAAAASGTPASAPARSSASFARALERATLALDRMGPAVPSSGAELGAAEALALQAALYRNAERLELASKLLDHGVGAVKTLLQTRL